MTTPLHDELSALAEKATAAHYKGGWIDLFKEQCWNNRDLILAALEAQAWRDMAAAPSDWTAVDLWVVNKVGDGERLPDCRASLSNGVPDWHYDCPEMGWTRIRGTPVKWKPLPTPPESPAP